MKLAIHLMGARPGERLALTRALFILFHLIRSFYLLSVTPLRLFSLLKGKNSHAGIHKATRSGKRKTFIITLKIKPNGGSSEIRRSLTGCHVYLQRCL